MSPSESFWDYVDQLVAESSIIIDRRKGTPHPRFSSVIYPVDYGYLDDTRSMDGHGIDVWVGTSHPEDRVDAILCVVDLLKRDSEIKILLRCTEDETREILSFTNSHMMRGLLIRREGSQDHPHSGWLA